MRNLLMGRPLEMRVDRESCDGVRSQLNLIRRTFQLEDGARANLSVAIAHMDSLALKTAVGLVLLF